MTPETAKALSELGRVAARLAGVPDDVPITMAICPDREHEWCDLDDDYVEENEDLYELPQTVDTMDMNDLDQASDEEFFYAQSVA